MPAGGSAGGRGAAKGGGILRKGASPYAAYDVVSKYLMIGSNYARAADRVISQVLSRSALNNIQAKRNELEILARRFYDNPRSRGALGPKIEKVRTAALSEFAKSVGVIE